MTISTRAGFGAVTLVGLGGTGGLGDIADGLAEEGALDLGVVGVVGVASAGVVAPGVVAGTTLWVIADVELPGKVPAFAKDCESGEDNDHAAKAAMPTRTIDPDVSNIRRLGLIIRIASPQGSKIAVTPP